MPKILLLEDTYSIQLKLKKVLTNAGFEVIAFDNPVIASKHLRQNKDIKINAIVCDWNMPRKTGIEFLISLRNGFYERKKYLSPLSKKTPFVMCTMHEDKKYIDKAMEHGADFYQKKSPKHSLKPMLNFLLISCKKL